MGKKNFEKQKQEAMEDLAMYTRDLEELDAIAAASKATVPDEASLLEVAVKFDRQSCLAFVAFAKRSSRAGADPNVNEESCDEQRADLQEKFDEAYKETRELMQSAQYGVQ